MGNITDNRVWFITGASSGFGLILTQLLLGQGYQVSSTSRDKDKLNKEIEQTPGLTKQTISENFLALNVDLLSPKSCNEAIAETIKKFKRLDVVVSNAGFSQMGAFEEVTDKEMRNNFEINLFAPMNVFRAAIPYLRESAKSNKLGPRIYNISSIAGFAGSPYLGPYTISKFALDGLSESLWFELRQFGIKVTSVRPGFFRTPFMKQSFAKPSQCLDIYKEMRDTTTSFMDNIYEMELGDPKKAMEILIKLSQDKTTPPLYLFMGEDSFKTAQAKIKQLQRFIDQYKSIAGDLSTPPPTLTNSKL